LLLEERKTRAEIEGFLAEASISGGVVLGRGGAVVLGRVSGALHAYLFADREVRLEHAMEIEGIDRETAQRRLPISDRARNDYVQGAYGVDGEDPYPYHLLLNTGAIDPQACVDLMVAASNVRRRQATTNANR
jgi:cytidylate kinase